MTDPDVIVQTKADLLVRATHTLGRLNTLIARMEADVATDTAGATPRERRRLDRADKALADIDHYLKILEAAYETKIRDERGADNGDR